MDTHAAPEQTQHDAVACGPPIRKLFRDVIADRLPDRMPLQAAMLFSSEIDPDWNNQTFLAEFYNEILHQDTCQPNTADGLVLLAALAVDDRVPVRQRFEAVGLLFRAATVAERHLAESWPATPHHADPDSEARARNAALLHTPDLLARWSGECFAVRLALAGLAVVFPTDRTLPALAARLHTFMNQHPQGTDIGDYLRFVLVLAAQDDSQTLAVTENLTDAYWTGTVRGVPTRHELSTSSARCWPGSEPDSPGQRPPGSDAPRGAANSRVLAQLLWTCCGALLVTASVACTGERSCRLDTWPVALRSTSPTLIDFPEEGSPVSSLSSRPSRGCGA